MKHLNGLHLDIQKEVKSWGFEISVNKIAEIQRAESDNDTASTQQIKAILLDVLNAYFGINYDNISDALLTACADIIERNYKGITGSELINAYRFGEVAKIKGVGISVSEVCAPLLTYFDDKKKVFAAQKSLKNKALEAEIIERESRENYERLKKRALNEYERLVGIGATQWTLDETDALMISAEISKGIITAKEKEAIYMDVLEREQIERNKLNPRERDRTNSVFELMRSNVGYATYTIRAKCAVIVINKVLNEKSK